MELCNEYVFLFLACNAVAMFEMGVLTMKNYGLRRNCTTSIIYPEQIKLLNVDVGVTSESKKMEAEVGLTDKVIHDRHVSLVYATSKVKTNLPFYKNKTRFHMKIEIK